jgi:purine-cytosine permease-like protein
MNYPRADRTDGTELADPTERGAAGDERARVVPRIRPGRLLRAGGVWVGLAGAAVALGVAREAFLTPVVGAGLAHVLGTVAVVTVVVAVAAWYFRRVDHTPGEAAAVAIGWPLATVAFEFGFGHYVVGHSWSTLLADYNVLAGRIWVLIPLAMVAAPLAFGWLAARRRPGGV